MDIFKIFNEAGNAFNRVVQQAEEKLLNAEKTVYDEDYDNNLKKLEILMIFTESIIEETEAMLEPNPAYRIEGKIMEKVDKKQERATPLENLGAAFESGARAIREYCPELMDDFTICGKYETKLGISAKQFQAHASEVYVNKLKKILNVDLFKYREKADYLENLRLDHDSLKIRVKKAITVSGKEQLEQEFEIAKEKFDSEIGLIMDYFKDIDKFFNIHRSLLKDFIEAQSNYFMGCHKELEKFKNKLKDKPEISFSNKDNFMENPEKSPNDDFASEIVKSSVDEINHTADEDIKEKHETDDNSK